MSTPRLWWQRLREHLTPRSVYFQGALRLAAALAVARLLAGVLDLSHGFWVLLTILTLLRASAAETRALLWPALVGTVIGSVAAAALLVVGIPPTAFAVALPLVMLIGFAAGPLLGLGWAQALFTLVIALVFAQVSPVDWHLAEARVVDVAVGAAIGLATGLLAWPRGGSGELHRAAGRFLAAAGRVVRETVDVLTHGDRPGAALPQARDAGELVQASWALYQTERHPPASVDWQATLLAGHHAVRGAEWLLAGRPCPTGASLACPASEPLSAEADDVAARYEQVADALLRGDHAVLGACPARAAPRRLAHEPRHGPVPPRRPARLAGRPARRPRPHPRRPRRAWRANRLSVGGRLPRDRRRVDRRLRRDLPYVEVHCCTWSR